jgi:YARHG domain
MNKIILVVGLIFFISCKKADKTSDSKLDTTKNQKKIVEEKEYHQDLYGNWVGEFIDSDYNNHNQETSEYSNKINLTIKKITKQNVFGQTTIEGVIRPISGEILNNGNELTFNLKHAGDDLKDGKFNFKIEGDTLTGTWKAFSKSQTIQNRQFQLVKKEFKYNPKYMIPGFEEYQNGESDVEPFADYYDPKEVTFKGSENDTIVYTNTFYRKASDIITKLNASTKILTEKDLKNLKKLELEIIRNTIFARHGYSFKKKTYRQFFDPVAWYVPISDNVANDLTKIENNNIQILQRFEKYATDNYDHFSR